MKKSRKALIGIGSFIILIVIWMDFKFEFNQKSNVLIIAHRGGRKS